MPRSLHDLTFDQLRELIVAEGLRPAHAGTLWNTLHFKAMADPLARVDLLPPLRKWLTLVLSDGSWSVDVPPVSSDTPSSDGLTHKFLLRMADALVELVDGAGDDVVAIGGDDDAADQLAGDELAR